MSCIFCKISTGEIPSYKVYEDEQFFGFLDIRPLTRGHSLLVPKKHWRWVHLVEPFAQYWLAAQKAALAAINGLDAETVNFLTLGFEVPHAHIHIIPRYPDDGHGGYINWNLHQEMGDEEMARIAAKIKQLPAKHGQNKYQRP